MSRNRNWIEGAWCPSESGREFDARSFGSWPRSGAEDVALAIEGFARGAGEWRCLTPDERADTLGEVLDVWEDEGELERDFALALGLSRDALEEARSEALELGDALIATPPALGDPAPVLARACAGSLGSGLVRAVFPSLLEGRAVLLLSDADAPLVAARFCELLEEVGLPRGLAALIHDGASTSARAALASGRFGRVALVEPVERGTALAEQVAESPRPAKPKGAAFGRGVLPASAPQLVLETTAQSTQVVLRRDDPEARAREICVGAFGAEAALSGQRAGQVGRVICHERHLSRFTAALLEAVDALERPCQAFDRGLAGHVERVSRLGLDEGATLIRGPFGAPSGSRRAARDAILTPSVFTNVEPRMALARADRPAPVLSILRSSSDEEAADLVESFAAGGGRGA